jgi:hypothetical protein
MPTTKVKETDPHAPRTFRRATTATWAIVMVVFFVAVAIFAGVNLRSHGFFAAIAPICLALPLIAFAVLSFYLPRVIVSDDAAIVRNALATFRVPYAAISAFVPSRVVLLIKMNSGQKVPVTAYASGSGAKLFGHAAALKRLTDAIEAKMYAAPKATGDEQVVRTALTREIAISIATVVIAVVVLVIAITT